MKDLSAKAFRKTINTKSGDIISYDEFLVGGSTAIIDEIDRLLARHFCLTDDELDLVINYDIKYRMGQDGEEGDE